MRVVGGLSWLRKKISPAHFACSARPPGSVLAYCGSGLIVGRVDPRSWLPRWNNYKPTWYRVGRKVLARTDSGDHELVTTVTTATRSTRWTTR